MEELGKDLDIILLPAADGKTDAEPHGKQPEFRKTAEQTNYGDRLLTRANIVGVTHGNLLPGGDPATLLILEFRFLSMQKGRRFTSCNITVKFEDSGGDADFCPEVWRMVPEGVYALHKTEKVRTVKIMGKAGIQGPSVETVGANTGVSWEREETDKVEAWTQLTGTRYQLGGGGEKDDAMIWVMQENGAKKTGIPTFLRAAVLLRREADVPFNVTISVKAKVDFNVSQTVSDLRGLIGKPRVVRVPPRPLGIDAAVDPRLLKVATADPKVVDLTKLDELDIAQFADVMLITLL
ncbi:hypothetical protein DL769_004929 [Monosporascus sp. CRB-8-3]|nr:hypothetical protein DL769_004929 [Monosporascus sp. CRB-8-3]